MTSIRLDQNGDCSDDIPVEQLLSVDCDDCVQAQVFSWIPSDSCDVDAVGEPDILPRLGDEYQVELPPHVGKPDKEVRISPQQNFVVALPIPLTWVSGLKHEGTETVSDSKNVGETGSYANGEVEHSHDLVKPKEESHNLSAEVKKCKFSGEGHLLVPGLVSQCWSDAEKASFLLGLYIFEKNFVVVRRFMETKDMGEILSYYYGKFYGSVEYRRWSECRKTKSKKCVYGRRIFSGLRQQELLSRILPKVSEECKSTLLEVSKTFGDEKMTLADYVSSLKAMVGMNILVEAIGIGTGKQDLTEMALEPSRSNQAIPVRPEIPTGKACSSLTTTEIVKFLSGDYRLSKARSNDLFWEAVWPRLLARGWHSEQPKRQGPIVGSSPCLVFLIPSVAKFSRRKLVKGEHYFDSVPDVLSKVAKEPGLIELDNEEGDCNTNKEEHEWSGERKMQEDENDLPTRQRHFYMQPRTSNHRMDAIKFTVVDTSLSGGKIRELRTLPSEISNVLIPHDDSEDSDQDTVEDDAGKSDTINTSTIDASVTDNLRTAKSHGEMPPGRKKSNINASYHDTNGIHLDTGGKPVPKLNEKDLNDNKQFKNVFKSKCSRKKKQGNMDPIGKRCRRLNTDGHEETRAGLIQSSMVPKLENGITSCCSGLHEFNEQLSSQVNSCQDKLSSTSSSKGSLSESIEFIPNGKIHATEPTLENLRTQSLIDLNLPQVSPAFENSALAVDLRKEQENQSIKSDDHRSRKSLDAENRSQQQPNVIPPRHSTRNRPPTARALEAVANGYLTVNRRRKGRDTSQHEDLTSRPSQRARVVVGFYESTNSSTSSKVEEAENGVSTSGN